MATDRSAGSELTTHPGAVQRDPQGVRGVLRQLGPYLIGASIFPIIAVLYWGQAVLKPVALALLLAFLLGPVVGFLERTGLGRTSLGRIAAVVLVVLLVFSLLGAIGFVIAQQVVALGNELPQYRGNLKQKIADLRGASRGGALEKAQSTASEVIGELQKEDRPPRDSPGLFPSL
jgi:predicted PurR-regulated permease PerM